MPLYYSFVWEAQGMMGNLAIVPFSVEFGVQWFMLANIIVLFIQPEK